MVECFYCKKDSAIVSKKWNYGVFEVSNISCNNCGRAYKLYFKNGQFSHKIDNSGFWTDWRKILCYLSKHEEASIEEIAKNLDMEELTVLSVLQSLEKTGKVIPQNTTNI
jgi:transcription elongation factor Elf1